MESVNPLKNLTIFADYGLYESEADSIGASHKLLGSSAHTINIQKPVSKSTLLNFSSLMHP